ncbi:MAG: ion transporter [Rhizobiales bacterium]|nr:ion transporter [Hyphomicrobiales bacterium]
MRPEAVAQWRAKLRSIVSATWFENLIIGLIVINAITLGLETSATMVARFGTLLSVIDTAVLIVFVAELAARWFAHGPRLLRDPWTIFDTLVVAVAVLPASGDLSVLRALRILRALRLVSAFPRMRRVVEGLFAAIPSMSTVIVLLILIFYVFAVMATKMFGSAFEELFGTLGASAYTLFQVMTLEGWSDGVARPVMERYPWAWAFFVPFILITSFAVLNLFIGIIVDAMQTEQTEVREEVHEAERHTIDEIHVLVREVKSLRAEVAAIKAAVERERAPGDG